jgi:penicillin-binding protein 1A
MLANGGKQIKATFIDRIQNRYGRTIWRHDTRDCSQCDAREWSGQEEPTLVDDRPQVIDPISAFQMTEIMEGVVQRGTATRLKVLNRPIAGKTGTTNNYKDAWFVGYTPDMAFGVYVGFDQPAPMGHGETGGSLAVPIIRDFVREALVDAPPVPFRAPPGALLVRVNHKSGLPAGAGDKTAILEVFKPGQEPYGAVARDAEGGGEDMGDQDDMGTASVEPAPAPGPQGAVPQPRPRSTMAAPPPEVAPQPRPRPRAQPPKQSGPRGFGGIF